MLGAVLNASKVILWTLVNGTRWPAVMVRDIAERPREEEEE
jgi:hypothetical protein